MNSDIAIPLHQHWLVKAALMGDPDRQLPPGMELASAPSRAWLQVATIFGITTAELARRVATVFELQAADLADFQPEDGSVVPERTCREMGLAPLWHDDKVVHVAIADPRLTQDQLKLLSIAAGRAVVLTVLPPDEIDTCQTRLFAGPGQMRDQINQIDLLAASSSGEEKHVVKLTRAVLRAAIDQGASDIHIHPFVGGGAIRFRIDGLLRRIATVPMESLNEISRYLGSNAALDPNPLKPRDGRLRLRYGQRMIDLRLSILPVHDGERIVCRLLDQGRSFSLKNSGFAPGDEQALRKMVTNSAGMVLMTGPTGSGKTSTLYALLASLNQVDVNIMTIEDPVEYVLPGVSQVQVNAKQGLSFADTLRSILRQDPDIVLIGEIRDSETARIAAQAALTGHLVLSTLHTNDALGTIPRLLDLGVEPSMLADALIGVVAQRLVRKLCEHCRQPATDPYRPGEAEFLRIVGEAPPYRSVGCDHCGLTGYKGRLPVIERLEMTPALRQSLLAGVRGSELLSETADSALRSMAASARDWIVSGLTTPQEAQRVLGMGFWNGLGKEYGIPPGNMAIAESETVNVDGRLSLLLLSDDEALHSLLAAQMDYALVSATTVADARQALESNRGISGLIIDGQLLTHPEEMLTTLRTELAWSGLPVLFITGEGSNFAALQETLARFGARTISHQEAITSALATAVISLLQTTA